MSSLTQYEKVNTINHRTPSSPARAVPALAAACALFWGAVAQAQPYLDLSSTYPDGTVQFQPTNTFAFTLGSGFGITAANISVQLAATNLSGTGSSQLLTSGNGLTITGPATSPSVTTPLTSNTVYHAVIVATDAGGPTTNTVVFDTITPSYTWEAEDWDYSGGQFIDNPQTNAYMALAGTVGVDAFNPNGGNSAYRSQDTGDPGNELNGDIPRVQYTDPNNPQSDYDFGWTTGGSLEWANYTRHYPAGKWNIFFRAAGWAASTESADMFLGGTNGTRLGGFAVPNTATAVNTYQNYAWAPVIDVAGNLVEWDTDGSKQTLTLQTVQGSWNGNFFMLMPVNPNYKPVPFVSGISPNSSTMFPPDDCLYLLRQFRPGDFHERIVLTLNGTTPYGLTYNGSSCVLTGSFPLATNATYSVTIVSHGHQRVQHLHHVIQYLLPPPTIRGNARIGTTIAGNSSITLKPMPMRGW